MLKFMYLSEQNVCVFTLENFVAVTYFGHFATLA